MKIFRFAIFLLFSILIVTGCSSDQSENRTVQIQLLQARALENDAKAQYLLGSAYEEGKLTARDPSQSLFWYTKAAENGSSLAQYRLYVIYCIGSAAAKEDTKKALYWLHKSANNGLAQAQRTLGELYAVGQDGFIESDHKKALFYLEKAALQKEPFAMYQIGSVYGSGDKEAKYLVDQKKALEFIEGAATRGDQSARQWLAYAYKSGDTGLVPQDAGLAEKWASLAEKDETDTFSRIFAWVKNGFQRPKGISFIQSYQEKHSHKEYPPLQE